MRRSVVTALLALALVLTGTNAAGASTTGTRDAGRPTSDNGASSFHVRPADPVPATDEVSVVLEVREAPTVAALYFWALQVDFVDRAGVAVAGAHLGLQWLPASGGTTAVNFGGYRYDGGRASELKGRTTLSSADGDPNTFGFTWKPSTPYRLRIFRDGGWWAGEVTDLDTGRATVVRRLHAGGELVAKPVVWSEVFADCDAPRTAVRWSGLTPAPDRYRASYQSYERGGCTNTSTELVGDAIVQRTHVRRTVADWAILMR
jgi:hypothetical protein